METWKYPLFARLLHWLMAILIIAQLAMGWIIETNKTIPDRGWYFALHKSIGIILLLLIIFRIISRLTYRVPPLPRTVPRWQQRFAHGVQHSLYVMMVLMPLSGLLGALFGKNPLSFFGYRLFDGTTQYRDVSKFFFQSHYWIVWILTALIVLHIAGAMKHLLINKDRVFQRMWFKDGG